MKRPKLKTVAMEEMVKQRLKEYLDTLRPRPTEAAIISIAVEQYLDRQQKDNRN